MSEQLEYSTLKLAKARTLFSVYDHDGNGFIEKSDFEAVAENFTKLRSLAPESDESQRLRHLFLSIWDDLQEIADEDRDGQVSFQEMLAYLDLLTHDPNLYYKQVLILSKLLFGLLDADNDGSISQAEYQEFAHCLRFQVNTENFFLFTGGEETLSAAQLHKCIQEFYYSEDPTSVGNLFFGDLEAIS